MHFSQWPAEGSPPSHAKRHPSPSPPKCVGSVRLCAVCVCVCVVMLVVLLCMLSVSVAAVSSSPVPSSSSHKGHQSPTGPTHRGRWGASPYERHVLVSRTPSEQHGLVPATERGRWEAVRDVTQMCCDAVNHVDLTCIQEALWSDSEAGEGWPRCPGCSCSCRSCGRWTFWGCTTSAARPG